MTASTDWDAAWTALKECLPEGRGSAHSDGRARP